MKVVLKVVLLSRAIINSNLNLHESRIQAAVNRQCVQYFLPGKLKCFAMRHLPHLSVAAWQQINHCVNLIGQD
jgi:hypothetical protein